MNQVVAPIEINVEEAIGISPKTSLNLMLSCCAIKFLFNFFLITPKLSFRKMHQTTHLMRFDE